ncbi:O-antigen ligase family protein [Galbibacter mesophilus]|uniref:O-antigen ligase family protein n=1 Tax=Galbibacter mesophilus TaxID=379069 RepID=UPI00191FCB55|nr:O-antigen ligase family protein [Galbibacter mesophilus]MCM5663487.1 O-antigen ligase family protein [Galbibacter mesophilus]
MIGINLMFSYFLLSSYRFDLKVLYKDYFKIIKIVCYFSVIQLISIIISFKWGADLSYLGFEMGNFEISNLRLQGWFEEPSFLVYMLIPALYFAVYKILDRNNFSFISLRYSILIISILLLTFSSTGYLALLFTILSVMLTKYNFFKKPISLFILTVTSIALLVCLYNINDVKTRVDDTIGLFFDSDVTKEDIDSKNLSTYALYSNFMIVKEASKKYPILGSGLGSHVKNYDFYLDKVIPDSNFKTYYKLNRSDANSLILRLISELGLFGLFIFLIYIFRYRVKSAEKGDLFYFCISNGIFILFLSRAIRQGHYTSLGFIMFILIYFFAFKIVKRNEGN